MQYRNAKCPKCKCEDAYLTGLIDFGSNSYLPNPHPVLYHPCPKCRPKEDDENTRLNKLTGEVTIRVTKDTLQSTERWQKRAVLVLEKALGRTLRHKVETIRYKDRDPGNSHLTNLILINPAGLQIFPEPTRYELENMIQPIILRAIGNNPTIPHRVAKCPSCDRIEYCPTALLKADLHTRLWPCPCCLNAQFPDKHTRLNKMHGFLEYRRNGKWRAAHLLTIEGLLGRALSREEWVKFRDHDKGNTRPDNLYIVHHTAPNEIIFP